MLASHHSSTFVKPLLHAAASAHKPLFADGGAKGLHLAKATAAEFGTLDFDPYAEERESGAEYACVVGGPPVLSDIVSIEEQRA